MTAIDARHGTTRRRRAANIVACSLLGAAVILAVVPLVLVLVYTASRGARSISLHFFTQSMRGVGPRDTTGGVHHAIIGTLEQVVLATLMAVPFGLLVAIYIVEYGRGVLRSVIRFLVDVMTGIPSIVAGLFIYAFWVLGLHQGFSGFAAAMALAVLMLPVVVRSTEEMLKLVPDVLREASYALGVPRWRAVVSVVLPTALAGITTGVLLAVARVTGETAPLLLTAFGSDNTNTNAFHGAQQGLPMFVYFQAGSAFNTAIARAWAGALSLIAFVLVLTVVARVLTSRNRIEAG